MLGNRRFVRHPAVTVRGATDHTLEQTQDGAHAIVVSDRGHQLHFRSTGVREADFHATGDQRFEQFVGSVHGGSCCYG
jgi:hypothetical protein